MAVQLDEGHAIFLGPGVIEGEVEFTIGDETVRAGPGTFFAAPPGVRHGFAIPGPGRARFLNIHAPATGFLEGVRERTARTPS
jgi:mannose-6-phosphate isomerase-like protein (cupin superfamily)